MTTLTRQDLNFGQVVADVLSEFLEVAVHLILYVREVYPVGIFQKRKKYNVPVQMSCHPELNQYIQDTLHCVKPLLEKNDVEKVVVVILDKEHRPVEKFVFEITQPPLLSIKLGGLKQTVSLTVLGSWRYADLSGTLGVLSTAEYLSDLKGPLYPTSIQSVQTPSCLMWSSCFEPSFLRLVCVTLSSTIILQAARLQFSCTQEKLPLGTWRRYRSSRTSPGSWQMSKMSTCMIPG
ncbi:mitotic spindle assembly checkpoint protein MAD2B isoform X1 [Rattus norvegicus]|uniref:Isoform 2 of Mitotic spindle assembly checkpoint protein MAD2B n=1 Tax=Rattus norvegicus TaxID=10116 RepID=D3Z8D9-2|nr:mitotic spindle assembly checkpoint protein MAD2B isoform 2 [Rattus norvegicus]XP_006239452.1 mitotic spindle assembly checkpoint protein MAD2B isoform X1 [Rattus norvegicus]XP_008762478.1 mitotic spindle assembly checkpoint protein MAD2B isoform X1 [Rattus norvegicus]XP_038966022.1 mitotic spindle assembly checkpoint protein MAD2B isoform X1 [Rattus norvegicus]AAH87687.1 MAD2 mitotic arrest deficient-like 2 (yeast) [Rattus norvegicus]|eukprot:NP_001012106.1 mitotic spindle assembly checkpoint protein MAD2B [Rattus norvegicus]